MKLKKSVSDGRRKIHLENYQIQSKENVMVDQNFPLKKQSTKEQKSRSKSRTIMKKVSSGIKMKQFLSQAKRIDSKTFRKCPKAIPKSNGKILLKISSMHLKMRNKKFLPPSDRFSVRSLHRQQPKPLLLQQKSSMIKFTLVPKIKSLTIKTQRPMKKIKSIVFKSKIKPKILGKNSSLILDSTLKKHPLEVIPTTEIESNNKIMIDPLLMAEEDSSANIPISPPHPLSPSPPPPLSTNYIDISIPKQISSVPKQPKSSSSFETSPDKMDHIVPVPVAEYKDRSDQQVSSMSGLF